MEFLTPFGLSRKWCVLSELIHTIFCAYCRRCFSLTFFSFLTTDAQTQSEALLTEALMVYQNGLPPDHPEIADCMDKVGKFIDRLGWINWLIASVGSIGCLSTCLIGSIGCLHQLVG